MSMNIYKSIIQQKKKKKSVIVYDDMVVDSEASRKLKPIVAELYMKGR